MPTNDKNSPQDRISPAAVAALENEITPLQTPPQTPTSPQSPAKGSDTLEDPFSDVAGEPATPPQTPTSPQSPATGDAEDPPPSGKVAQHFNAQREKHLKQIADLEAKHAEERARLEKAIEEARKASPEAAELEELRKMRAKLDVTSDPQFRAQYDGRMNQLVELAKRHAKAAGVSEADAEKLVRAPLEQRYNYLATLNSKVSENPRISAFLGQLNSVFTQFDALSSEREQKVAEAEQNYQKYLEQRQGTDRERLLADALQEQYENLTAFQSAITKLASEPITVGEVTMPPPRIFESAEGKAAMAEVFQTLKDGEITREDVVRALALAKLFPTVYVRAAEYKREAMSGGRRGPGFGGGGAGGGAVPAEIEDELEAVRTHMGLQPKT